MSAQHIIVAPEHSCSIWTCAGHARRSFDNLSRRRRGYSSTRFLSESPIVATAIRNSAIWRLRYATRRAAALHLESILEGSNVRIDIKQRAI